MKSFLLGIFVPLLLAVLGIVVYRHIPAERTVLQLVPSSEFRRAIEVFNDSMAGGASRIRLEESQTGGLRAHMHLSAPEGQDAWAGFGWLLQESNWTFVDSLYIEVRTDNLEEIELKLLTFDPNHTRRTDRNTYKQIVKELPVSSRWHTLAVPIDHFYIPQWWFAQQGVDPKFDSKHLERVFRLDIRPSSHAPQGQDLRIEVRSLVVVGSSNRNFAILFVYLFLLMVVALGGYPRMRRRS